MGTGGDRYGDITVQEDKLTETVEQKKRDTEEMESNRIVREK